MLQLCVEQILTIALKGDCVMTKRTLYIFSDQLEIPKAYETEFKQEIYATAYRNGRATVDYDEDISMSYLKMLCEEYLKGYLDGVRDEMVFQHDEAIKKALE